MATKNYLRIRTPQQEADMTEALYTFLALHERERQGVSRLGPQTAAIVDYGNPAVKRTVSPTQK